MAAHSTHILLLLVGSLLMASMYLAWNRTFVGLQHHVSLPLNQRYLFIEVDGGLTNQRLAILYALYHSFLYNYTFVKPNLIQCCYPLYYNSNITTISFDTFYSLDTSTSSILYVDRLPTHYQQECQQQFKTSQGVADILRIAENRSYYQVQCLKFGAAFYHLSYLLRKRNNVTTDSEYNLGMVIHGNFPGMNRFRTMLNPSARFQKLADQIYDEFIKHASWRTGTIIAIHIRLESDFKRHCGVFSRKHRLECYIDVSKIRKFLLESRKYVPLENFKLLILSGLSKSDLVMALSSLCEFNFSSTNAPLHNKYQCIYKEMIYPIENLNRTNIPFTGLSYAYLDYLLAHRAHIFLGNYYSSLSTELYHEFQISGKETYFYNQVCEKNNSTVHYESHVC